MVLYSLFQEGNRHSAVARAVITGARPRSAAILRRFMDTLETEIFQIKKIMQ